MRKVTYILLLLICACLGARAEPIHLFNGDFEQPAKAPGLAPPGWFIDEQSDAFELSMPAGVAHGGKGCLRIKEDTNHTSCAVKSRLYPAIPGQTYRASCQVFNETGDGWLYLEFYSNEDNRIAEKHAGTGKVGGWNEVALEDKCPPTAKYVGVLLYSSNGNVGASRFDDVAIDGPQGPGEVLNLDLRPAETQVAEVPKMLDIGSRLELFVDDYLIESLKGLTLQLHAPERREIALTLDSPWDGDTSHYITVFKDDDRYRMYYRGSTEVPPPAPHPELAAYAESKDGITWTKPKLGLYELGGNKSNAIVWMGEGCHNFTPFKDANPACKPEERYKALGGGPLIALASPDGIHWQKMHKEPVITEGAFDSQNLAFYDTVHKQYVCYLRDFKSGVRTIRTCTSQDFIHWTRPKWLMFGNAPREQLYTNAITPYFRAPHIFMGFPKRFIEERKIEAGHRYQGLSDGVFMTSRDGLHFHRFLEAFLRPGLDQENWTDRNNHIAYGMFETAPGEISLYALEHYQHPTNRIRRLTIRTDGFVSLHADAAGGEMVTKPLKFAGKELVLNVSTSIAGSVRVELQSENGKALPGFGLGDCPDIYGDQIERKVTWKGGADLGALQGAHVRLRFVMRDADVYSLRFR